MKVLYAIQGTGNGHISRAGEIIPVLKNYCDVEILISGNYSDIHLEHQVSYRLKGLSFKFDGNGQIDIQATIKHLNFKRFSDEIRSLPVTNYDLIINDFEPVSAWAALIRNVPCYSLSHQSAVIDFNSPKPIMPNFTGWFILNFFAPAITKYGFHFESYNKNIFTPVIRSQVREQVPVNDGHYTVYLPSYADHVLYELLSRFFNVKWEVFSKTCKEAYKINNVKFIPIDNKQFIQSMAHSAGIICNAGFETPAEALYLGKKLLVIPIKSQYEQFCNAESLKQLGVPVLKSLSHKQINKISDWIMNDATIRYDYPDITADIIRTIIEKFISQNPHYYPGKLLSLKSLRS